jgi:RNA polymerase sigma-70 factor (ECF subfamily)
MSTPANWHLERYRPLLKLQARQLQQDPRLLVRFDWSDLVQQTLLEAHGNLARFKGKTEGELVQWLRKILTHTVIDHARHERADCRDIRLEKSFQTAIEDSSARLDKLVADQAPSPSEQFHKQELLVHLAEAIEQLPQGQRDVLIARDLLSKSIRDIAADLELTEKAVAGLLFRARRKLRELMAPFEER